MGYARPGFDADLLIWGSHLLSMGATPSQAYIDGRRVLKSKVAAELLPVNNKEADVDLSVPGMRPIAALLEAGADKRGNPLHQCFEESLGPANQRDAKKPTPKASCPYLFTMAA